MNDSKNEWRIAHQYLDDAPDGTKLPYSVINDEGVLVIRDRFQQAPKSYQTTRSFFKVAGKIYELKQGKSHDALLHEGDQSKVKYVVNKEGGSSLSKIGRRGKVDENEYTILDDMSQSLGAVRRLDKPEKYYVILKFLGTCFTIYLQSGSLQEKDRLDIAIDLCLQVYFLHNGRASRTGTPRAHLDLNPNNVTIDNDGVHLIDFEYSKSFPKNKGHTGSKMFYIPNLHHPLTKEQIDTVSLLRMLYLPDKFFYRDGWVDLVAQRKWERENPLFAYTRMPNFESLRLLSLDHLRQWQIDAYINTEAEEAASPPNKPIISVVAVCALLISVKLGLQLPKADIVNDVAIAYAIVGLYLSKRYQEIAHVLESQAQVQLLGALEARNLFSFLEEYRNDSGLLDMIRQAQSFAVVQSLVTLKYLKLTPYYSVVLKSSELSTGINLLDHTKAAQGKLIHQILEDKSLSLVKVIQFLYEHEISFDINSVLIDLLQKNQTILEKNSDVASKVAGLLRIKDISPDFLDQLLQNKISKRLVAGLMWCETLTHIVALQIADDWDLENVFTLIKNFTGMDRLCNMIVFASKNNKLETELMVQLYKSLDDLLFTIKYDLNRDCAIDQYVYDLRARIEVFVKPVTDSVASDRNYEEFLLDCQSIVEKAKSQVKHPLYLVKKLDYLLEALQDFSEAAMRQFNESRIGNSNS